MAIILLALVLLVCMEREVGSALLTEDSQEMPEHIREMISQVKDMKSFVTLFNVSHLMRETESTGVVGRDGQSSTGIVYLDEACCAARPTVVLIEMEEASNSYVYPSYVILHRCSGSCKSHGPEKSCSASEIQTLLVNVFQIFWHEVDASTNDMRKEVLRVPMVNETACSCGCKQRQSCGDDEYLEWDESSCRCRCRYARNCMTLSNLEELQECCRCPENRYRRCSRRSFWDRESCSCRCLERNCQNGRVLDTRTCRCACAGQCRYGYMDQRTCECVVGARPSPGKAVVVGEEAGHFTV